jgi:hypothetical protein
VGSGAGASVNGKGVEISVTIVLVLSGLIITTFVDADVVVGEASVSCGVDIWLTAGAHPDRKMKTTGRRIRSRFMVYWLGMKLA